MTVTANTSTSPRTATITIGGQTSTVVQAGAQPVTTISPTQNVAATAGTASIAVTSNTSWTAASDSAWAVVSPTSGSNNGTVTVTVAANTSLSSRTATITIGGQTSLVIQVGATPVTTISPATISATAAAGTYPITVTSNTSWTAASNSSWVVVSPTSGSNNGTITVTVAANTATSPRTATIAIGGQTATVTQAAIPGTVNIINPLAISTLAGTAHQSGFADGTKGAALFANPTGGAVDASGNFFVADTDNNVIRKVTSAGVVTTIAGKAGVQGYVDGTGTAALFNSPVGVAVDSFGNVYVADTMNNVLREITPSGVVTTLAGSATAGISDGVGVAAGFNGPQGLTADIAGNLYVADTSNHTIRKVVISTRAVATLAGNAGYFGSSDGAGSIARFNYPSGVAVDASGNVFVADTENCVIRKIQPSGLVSTLAGLAGIPGAVDATGSLARFDSPSDLTIDAEGNVFIADTDNDTIRMLVPSTGVVTTMAGQAGTMGSADGTGAVALFYKPAGIAVGGGILYVVDTDNDTIRTASLPMAPAITDQPKSQVVTVGSSAIFTVTASGSPTMTYKWQFNGSAITGATSGSYSISSAQTGNAGTYNVVVSNGMGSVTSTAASLTVNAATQSPSSSGGGGGGAPSWWFYGVLFILIGVRIVRYHRRLVA